jgi:hypothetical protein
MSAARILVLVLGGFLSSLFLTPPALAASGDIGVVLLPGKNGTSGPKSLLGPLLRELEKAGMLVEAPKVPWSRGRYLDGDFDESMAEIDQAVARLKDRGARRSGIAGIAAIAPGHVVEVERRAEIFAESVAKARAMIAAGRGDEEAAFDDNNQGRTFDITAPARVYLSWFDPDGPAIFGKNAAALKPGTALLWILGDDDFMERRGKEYAFAKAPAHPMSAYVVVSGGHKDPVRNETAQIRDWIKSLN